MADRRSERGAGSGGRFANASVVQPSLTLQQLQQLNSERMIDSRGWNQLDRRDFQQRALAGGYRFPSGVNGTPHYQQPASPASTASAMSTYSSENAMHSPRTQPARSPHSIYAPSMASGSSAYASVQSPISAYTPSLISTSSATTVSSRRISNSEAPRQYYALPESDDDQPDDTVRTRGARLACACEFLLCTFTSDHIREWDTHCQSHFRGRLPKHIDCPFECDWYFSEETGEEAWRERYAHILNYHGSPRDCVSAPRRADRMLAEHLWRCDIIDAGQLKELRNDGRLSERSVYIRSARSDRRRQGQGRARP